MVITCEMIYIFIAILVICLIGFKKYIWFISIGYGASIAMTGIMMLILFNCNPALIIGSCIFIMYGLRLSGFLAYREIKSASYNKKMKNEISDGSHMPLIAKIMLWITCALLYITMTSPVIYRFVNNYGMDNYFTVGMIITVCGIVLEAESDLQKGFQKKKNPKRFCDKGLFKIVRCPNYLGELIIWTGVFVSGLNILSGIGQWIVAIIGYLGIVYIMFSGARRLEIRQDKNYGDDPEYKKYKKKTPILIPFIPLYSVKKHKWLVG